MQAAGTNASPLGRAALRTTAVTAMAAPVATNQRNINAGRGQQVALSQVARGRWRMPSGLEVTQRVIGEIRERTRPRDRSGESPTFRRGVNRALAAVNDAYQSVQRRQGIVSDQSAEGTRTVVVQMNRTVGYMTGRLWASRPALRYMRLKLRGNELLGATPTTRPNRIEAIGGRWRRPAAANHVRGDYASELRRLGLSQGQVTTATSQARLGLPSQARPGNAVDHLVVNTRGGFVASYHNQAGVPNWVGYAVRAGDVTPSLRRINNWRPDRNLPGNFRRMRADDHIIEGYDIGHLVQSAARKGSREANSETFLLSMNVPQTPNNNRGPWRHLEEHIRSEARQGNTVHVYTGPAFTGPRRTVGQGGAAIPDSVWKVAVIQPPNTSVGQRTRVIAINIPNDDSRVREGDSYANYRVSVADVERATGLRFFTNLPRDVARRLRSGVDDQDVPTLSNLDQSSRQAANANPRANAGNAGRARHGGYASADQDPAARSFAPRIRELGFNPNIGRFQARMAEMATRLEQHLGGEVRRSEANQRGTWVDGRNRSYTALRGDNEEGRFDARGFTRKLNQSLRRADNVVFDARIFHAPRNAEQARTIINQLNERQRSRVIVLQ